MHNYLAIAIRVVESYSFWTPGLNDLGTHLMLIFDKIFEKLSNFVILKKLNYGKDHLSFGMNMKHVSC